MRNPLCEWVAGLILLLSVACGPKAATMDTEPYVDTDPMSETMSNDETTEVTTEVVTTTTSSGTEEVTSDPPTDFPPDLPPDLPPEEVCELTQEGELPGDPDCDLEYGPEPWEPYGLCDEHPYYTEDEACFPFTDNGVLTFGFIATACETSADCGCEYCGAMPQCIGPYYLDPDQTIYTKVCVLSCHPYGDKFTCPGDLQGIDETPMDCLSVSGLYDEDDVHFGGVCANLVPGADDMGDKEYVFTPSDFGLVAVGP